MNTFRNNTSSSSDSSSVPSCDPNNLPPPPPSLMNSAFSPSNNRKNILPVSAAPAANSSAFKPLNSAFNTVSTVTGGTSVNTGGSISSSSSSPTGQGSLPMSSFSSFTPVIRTSVNNNSNNSLQQATSGSTNKELSKGGNNHLLSEEQSRSRNDSTTSAASSFLGHDSTTGVSSTLSTTCSTIRPLTSSPSSCSGSSVSITASTPTGGTSSGGKKSLCATCGQWHVPQGIHVYDYSESVDSDLLCRLCNQPLVNPLDTKCGHTFCTPCLKNRLVVNALCPVDGEIINFLECQQASNLVKKLLDKLLVICPNRDYCEEVLLARCELEQHLKSQCRGTVIHCHYSSAGCSFLGPRMAHAAHQQECIYHQSMGSGGTRSPLSHNNNTTGINASNTPFNRKLSSTGPTEINSDTLCGGGVGSAGEHISSAANRLTFDETIPSSPYSCASAIQEGVVEEVKIFRGEHCDLGISIVGGSDTPLNCIVIQEIYLDGVVARDGRLRPGDQILSVNAYDLHDATHAQAKREMSKLCAYCVLTVFREKVSIPRPTKSCKEEQITITLTKRPDKLLGIKIVGKKNKPGLYVLALVKNNIADLDGRMQKNDRILEINGHDLRHGTQDEALNVIMAAGDEVVFLVSRRIRSSTPDILRTGSGDSLPTLANTAPLSNDKPLVPTHSNLDNIHRIPSLMPGMMPAASALLVGGGPSAGSPVRVVDVQVAKEPMESLGMSVAGGLYSQRGHTPVYVTNLVPDGVLARTRMVKKGDVLLSINEVDLLGLSHDSAVQALKQECSNRRQVILRLLEGPETSSGAGNFMPSWAYWLQLPNLCQIPQEVKLSRDRQTGSLGFSIIGGSDCCVQAENGMTSHRPQPIVVKTIVPHSPAYMDGGLKCGDVLLMVNGYSMADIMHMDAVKLLKQCGPDVVLHVVSWPGTIV